jgi:hypothetical protein
MNAQQEAKRTQYLYLVGRLNPDNRLELVAPHLTDDYQNARDDPDSPLIAQFYDAAENLILRYGVPTTSYTAPKYVFPQIAIRGKVPFPPATRVVRFYHGGVLVHEIIVSEFEPEVMLKWEPADKTTGRQIISWEAKHSEGKPLEYFMRYSHDDGVSWQPVTFATIETKKELDFDRLPGGERCRIMLVATDGIRTTTAQSKSFQVPVKSCKSMIFAPVNGAMLDPSEPIIFEGQGFYLEENLPESEALFWTSSIDGKLGTGMILQVPKLSPGIHQITLSAGTGERAGEASISISVSGETHQQWVLS